MAKNVNENTSEKECISPLKITVVGINHDQKKAILFNPRCKSWDCPYCAEQNKQDWLLRGFRGAALLAQDGLELRFITLTSRPYATPTKSLYYFQQNWPKLVRRAAYHTNKIDGKAWHFFLIPEQHKTGVLHAHMIATTYLKTKWWKDNAYKTGFGYMAKSDQIKEPALVVGYITKYLGKSIEYTQWPKGFRRVRTDRSWPKTPEIPTPGWEWATHNDESAWFEFYLLTDYGYEISDRRNLDK